MLVQEEYVEVHALRRRGWSISAIARHLGRDRKTVRAYLSGERVPGQRSPSESDPFERFEGYVRQRLVDDPHVWASALFDEVVGFVGSVSRVVWAGAVLCLVDCFGAYSCGVSALNPCFDRHPGGGPANRWVLLKVGGVSGVFCVLVVVVGVRLG